MGTDLYISSERGIDIEMSKLAKVVVDQHASEGGMKI
jgi:hypothetical protein